MLSRELVENRREMEEDDRKRKNARAKMLVVQEEKDAKEKVAAKVRVDKQRLARRADRASSRMAGGLDAGMASGDPEELKDIFEEFDEDGSGSIDIKELGEAMTKLLGKRPHKKVIESVMQMADSDGNGELDFEEFQALAGSGELQNKLLLNPKFRAMHEVREGKRGEREAEAKVLADASAAADAERTAHNEYKAKLRREKKAEWKAHFEAKHKHLEELENQKVATEKAARTEALASQKAARDKLLEKSSKHWRLCARRRQVVAQNWQLFDAQRREMTRRHVSEAEQSTVHLRDRSALREGSKLVDTMSWSSNASHAHASRAHTASDAHGRQTRALSAAHTAEWRLSNSIAMDGDEANHDTRTAGRPLRSLKGSLSAGLQPAVAPQWRTAGDGLVPAKQRAGMPVRSYEYEEDHAPGSTAPAATRVPAWQAAHAQRADLGARIPDAMEAFRHCEQLDHSAISGHDAFHSLEAYASGAKLLAESSLGGSLYTSLTLKACRPQNRFH